MKIEMPLIRFMHRCENKRCGKYSNNTQDEKCAYCGSEIEKRPTAKTYEESLNIEKEWNRLPEK